MLHRLIVPSDGIYWIIIALMQVKQPWWTPPMTPPRIVVLLYKYDKAARCFKTIHYLISKEPGKISMNSLLIVHIKHQ